MTELSVVVQTTLQKKWKYRETKVVRINYCGKITDENNLKVQITVKNSNRRLKVAK